jgi:hypothetical protein
MSPLGNFFIEVLEEIQDNLWMGLFPAIRGRTSCNLFVLRQSQGSHR